MSRLQLLIIALVAGNLFLLGLEASNPDARQEPRGTSTAAPAREIPRIQLLAELEDTETGTFSRQCFTVGPFETRPTVDAIVEMLTKYTSSAHTRETEAFVDRGYWVYLPPYSDERGAHEAVNMLYDAGFDDVARVQNGEWNHSVSLGYFISQSNAVKHRDVIRELGLQAEFRIQRDDESRFWVDYEQQSGVEYASRILAGLVPPELHRPTACPEFSGTESLETAGT